MSGINGYNVSVNIREGWSSMMSSLVYMLLLLLICAALPRADVTPLRQAEVTHDRPDKQQQVKEKKEGNNSTSGTVPQE